MQAAGFSAAPIFLLQLSAYLPTLHSSLFILHSLEPRLARGGKILLDKRGIFEGSHPLPSF